MSAQWLADWVCFHAEYARKQYAAGLPYAPDLEYPSGLVARVREAAQ